MVVTFSRLTRKHLHAACAFTESPPFSELMGDSVHFGELPEHLTQRQAAGVLLCNLGLLDAGRALLASATTPTLASDGTRRHVDALLARVPEAGGHFDVRQPFVEPDRAGSIGFYGRALLPCLLTLPPARSAKGPGQPSSRAVARLLALLLAKVEACAEAYHKGIRHWSECASGALDDVHGDVAERVRELVTAFHGIP